MRALLAALALAAGAPASAQPITYEILAREGVAPPGLPGTVVETLTHPRLNEAGDVAYFAILEEGTGGVTTDSELLIIGPDGAGGSTVVAREGDPVPGAPEFTYRRLEGPLRFNDAGQIAFPARLRPNESAFLSLAAILGPAAGTGDLSLIARHFAMSPEDGIEYSNIRGESLSLGDDGAVAFTSNGIIWGPGAGGGVMRLVTAGDPVPGAAPGVLYQWPAVGVATLLRGAGLLALHDLPDRSLTTGGPFGAAGVVAPVGAALGLVARDTDPVPVLPGNTFTDRDGADPQMDAAGRVAFTYTITCSSPPEAAPFCGALFLSDAAGGLDVVATTSGDAPPDRVFAEVGGFSFTDSGDLVVQAAREGESQALWRYDGAGFERIVGVGDPVAAAGAIEHIGTFAANDSGQVAFWSLVGDGLTHDLEILLADGSGIRRVAAGQTSFEAGETTLWLVADEPYGLEWFNDAGEIAFLAHDEAGGQYAVRAVPEPSAVLELLAGAALLAAARRARAR